MVISDSRKKAHNILAAAGRRGIVKLIHVAADFCYGEIKAHKKPIATVCFSPTQETHLFMYQLGDMFLTLCECLTFPVGAAVDVNTVSHGYVQ